MGEGDTLFCIVPSSRKERLKSVHSVILIESLYRNVKIRLKIKTSGIIGSLNLAREHLFVATLSIMSNTVGFILKSLTLALILRTYFSPF